jgi:lipopolysaccharide transport system permease protein
MDPLDTPARRDVKVIRIEPSRGWVPIRFRELWEYRELLYFLIWRDVKVRYKQTALGAAWAIIQPVLTMVVFSLFFGRMAKIPSDGHPYPLFSLSALVPWSLFAGGLSYVSSSVVDSSNLVKKVYFPRLLIPLGALLSALVDFALALLVLLGMMLYPYERLPSANIVFLPLFVLLALVTSLGAGLWLAALNVKYRDVRYVVPFMVQLWLFASPIVYPSTLIDPAWRPLYGLNPMVGVVEGTRWALLGGKSPAPDLMIFMSSLAAAALLISGAFYFRRMEKTFADTL